MLLLLDQGFGVKRGRRERIVDVMSDAARHLTDSPQAFLLHDGLLALPEILIGPLKRAHELRLLRCDRDMGAQLADELAFPARKRVRLLSRDDESPEDAALRKERRDEQRPQSAAGEPLRERKRYGLDIR